MMKINILSLICIIMLWTSCQSAQNDKQEKVAASDTTTLKEEENSLSFLVIGDWGRCGDYHQKEVATQLNLISEKTDAEFIISTGDNFYDNGIRSIHDPLWMNSFENIYTGANLQKNWYVVLGNHDYRGNPQAQIDYSQVSRRWNMPSRYYSIEQEVDDTTSALFIFMDTNPFIKKYHKEAHNYADLVKQDTARQIRWLDSLLINSKAQWKIIVGHHPLYSGSTKHGNAEELIPVLRPRMEKYHVQVYFAGHEHDLQHLKPADGNVDYIVSGAGSETRPTEKIGITKYAKDISGFATTYISADSLKLYFVDYNGNVVYKMSRGR